MKHLIFTFGLPGCGKSTYINAHYSNLFNYYEYSTVGFNMDVYRYADIYAEAYKKPHEKEPVIVIAADEIKQHLPGYTNEHPEVVHERSVQIAKQLVVDFLRECDNITVLMDGGGINNNYTFSIINEAKKLNAKVTCISFDTPIEVCLERVNKRDRKVPVNVIYDKAVMMDRCMNRYKAIIDDVIHVRYFNDTYVILDMDGTICGYMNAQSDMEGNVDFVNNEFFINLRPVQHVIDFVKTHFDMENVYICTACPNSIAWSEKNKWLDTYFPEVMKDHRMFVGNKDYKYIFVKQFAEHMGWEHNDVVLVDDYHHTINKCKEIGIHCVHPSNIEAII